LSGLWQRRTYKGQRPVNARETFILTSENCRLLGILSAPLRSHTLSLRPTTMRPSGRVLTPAVVISPISQTAMPALPAASARRFAFEGIQVF
jgi:hypothetical protein